MSRSANVDRRELHQRLHGWVRGFAGKRIAVAADLVADEFVYGDIVRVSREAPVLILDHQRTDCAPGGGGNSVANLRALGARPLPVGVLGRDGSGERVIETLREAGVSTSGILRAAGYTTPTKRRILAGGVHTRRQQIVRVDSGQGKGELEPALAERLRRQFDRILPRAEGLLIADYDYGAASPNLLQPALRMARRQRIVVTVDSRTRIDAFRGVTACTPNQEELEGAAGRGSLDDGSKLRRATLQLLRRTRNRCLLVTLGSKGMALFRDGQRPVHVPAYGSDEVADVTGAGDTVIAAFTLGLASGAPADDAARLANYAAGLVVQKAGTATISPEELMQAIDEDLA